MAAHRVMYQDSPDGSNSLSRPTEAGFVQPGSGPPDAAAEREWRLARYARTMAR